MKPASRYGKSARLTLVLCCFLLWGCGRRSPEAESAVPTARAVSSSRVILPTAGGQTIELPPAMMTDTYALWHPLNTSEPKPPKRAPAIPAGAPAAASAAWLPPAETEVMRQYVYRLTHTGRPLAIRVLERAEKYLPVILDALKARGLPEELACLPMVESAFEPRAVSPAGAVGLWQLMPETARRFGLTVNAEVDERFDIRKSTAAATAYLATLHGMFNDWPLALAAYNCGEGAMRRALSSTGAMSLPELSRACRTANGSGSPLAEETLRFVPQFAAAVRIMMNSDKFGLTNHAVLSVGRRILPLQTGEPELKLVGRYESAPEKSPAAPARSRRIE